MTAPSYFSNHYAEAREKFLAACAARGLEVEHLHNPKAKGARGEALFTDVARLGRPGAAKCLVLTSATHGVEGYCGSGAQVGLLSSGAFADLPEDLCVVMIHAMNPYGFSHDRRVNEDNVDLNRNYGDFDAPLAANPAHAQLHPHILPEAWDGPIKDEADQQLAAYLKTHGQAAFQAAVSGGQYTHPDGIFYGGREATWSRRMAETVLPKYAGSAKSVGVIDFHTGLGPYGYGELISDGPPAQKARARAWYGDQVTDADAGTSTSAPLTGTFGHGVANALPGARIAHIALEYGTYDIARVLGAVRADNWLYQKGVLDSPLGAAIKAEIKDTFYPNADDWKHAVWTRASEVVDLALAGLVEER